MAFIHEGSCECSKSELDLFSVPATQTSIESGTYVEYYPVASLSGAAPFEFDVTGSGDDYLDLANSFLHVRARIVKVDGGNLDDDSAVGPVNNFLHSLFSQMDISLNGTLITSSTNTYAYRAYVETLLSYGSDATSAIFYQDEAGKMDDNANSGLVKRKAFSATSREIGMVGRIHSDIFFQERYMLNEVNMRIKLIRNNDAFCLMEDQGFVTVVTSAVMLIR